ncbi:cellulase family glycosylhydrolase [Mycobacterium parmense]|uniref:cellulase family glycosylhydrolase n=1 Tax=Mycobacterium parmense TaxID=185642 RepID=UPI001E623BAB|nr:cellulase family glycosylhydrolase [Mycobacterium parmense]
MNRRPRRTGRILMWLSLPVALIGVLALAPVEPVGPAQLGMCINISNTDAATVSREFDLISAMKVTWIRTDFDWSGIETQPGQFDWSYQDRVVREATARRLNVVAILDYSPTWARPRGTTSHTPPDHISDFANFANAAVARYAPLGVRTWEVWNEPNSSDFWQPLPDPEKYGELFRATAGAIRAVDPGATVLTGGLTRGTDSNSGTRISQTTFLEHLYANGAAQLASAVAVHPYSFPWLPSEDSPSLVGGFNDLPMVRDLMVRHGDAGKKVWITEFGAPTGTGPGSMSATDQANSVVQSRRQVRNWDWAGPLIYYELRDAGTDPNDIEQNFGLVRMDMSLKPAAEALMQ